MQHSKSRLNAKLLALALGTAPLLPVSGQNTTLQQEVDRRRAATAQAVDLLYQGREAYAQRSFEQAVDLYKQALNTIPRGFRTEVKRNEIIAHLADGSVALAQQMRRDGRQDEAKALLNDVLAVDPERFDAQKSLEYFDDPIRTNPALTNEHARKVDEVRRLLYLGEGHYNLGSYDDAIDQFHAVLRLDPYNKAARRWIERCQAIKSDSVSYTHLTLPTIYSV